MPTYFTMPWGQKPAPHIRLVMIKLSFFNSMALIASSPYLQSIMSNVQVSLLLIYERSCIFPLSTSFFLKFYTIHKLTSLFRFASPISSQNDAGSVTLTYPCNCLGHNQGAARPVPQKSDGPGPLVRWACANLNFTPTVNQAVPRTCEGKVSVTVLDDNTHPLGILGQQIILRVEHPNA